MTVTKFCGRCGKIMWDVNPCKRFCDNCRREKEKQKNLERYYRKKAQKQGISATQAKLAAKRKAAPAELRPRIKPLEQCVREAQKLGISYGQYVQRGYDKITWEEILQVEVL